MKETGAKTVGGTKPHRFEAVQVYRAEPTKGFEGWAAVTRSGGEETALVAPTLDQFEALWCVLWEPGSFRRDLAQRIVMIPWREADSTKAK